MLMTKALVWTKPQSLVFFNLEKMVSKAATTSYQTFLTLITIVHCAMHTTVRFSIVVTKAES